MTSFSRSFWPMLATLLPLSLSVACSSNATTDEGTLLPGGAAGAGAAGQGTGGKAGQSAAGQGQAGDEAGGAGGDEAGGAAGTAGQAAGGKAGASAGGQAGAPGQGGAGVSGASGQSATGGAGTSAAGGTAGAAGTSAAGGTVGAGAGGAGAGGAGAAGQPGGAAGQPAGGTDAGSAGAGAGPGGAGGSAAGANAGGASAGGASAGGASAGGASGGASGQGGKGGGWPTCDEQPTGSTKSTVSTIWSENPSDYEPVWLEGLTVTAISFGACSATTKFQCLVFLQTKAAYGSLAEGAHQGIKLFVSEKASPYFASLNVGDVVNVYGNAIRYTQFGQNELRIHVDLEHPGCTKKVGSAVPTPIAGVALADLTIDAYENTVGPLLVQVDTVKGRPTPKATETFALYESDFKGPFDGGIATTEVLTPYYLPGGQFEGLTPNTWTNFTSIGGVYSVFVITSGGTSTKYRTLAPRTQGEIVKGP